MIQRIGKPLLRRVQADVDTEDAIDHYLIESAAVATGFVEALENAYRGISRSPSIGAPRCAHELDLPGLRLWPCKRYPYLVFYVEHADHLEVWRVLPASRDIPSAFK